MPHQMETKRPFITVRVPRLTFITSTTPRRIPPERPPPPKISNCSYHDNNNNNRTEQPQPSSSSRLITPPLNKPPLPPKPKPKNITDNNQEQPPPLPPKKNTESLCSNCLVTRENSKPPPIPPRGIRKEEKFPAHQIHNQQATDDCLHCRDFTIVDRHAENFPRRKVASLQNLAYNLTNGFSSKTDKARSIFIWLHHNIAYDTESFFGCGRMRSQRPEATLQSGLAVCQGYAELFEALGRYSGLDVMVISGHGKGYGYQPPSKFSGQPFKSNHAWNGVRLDSEDWHLIDPCWGAGHSDQSRIYNKKLNTHYFTSSTEQFGIDHFPKNSKHQFICSNPILWNEYLMRDGPTVYGDFRNKGLSQESIQPASRIIHPGMTRFVIRAKCRHVSIPPQEQYVLLLTIDEAMTPFQVDSGRIWSCDGMVNPGSQVSINYLATLNGKDAKGVGVQSYKRSMYSSSFRGLCRWDVIAN